MVKDNAPPGGKVGELLAEVAGAAYRATLQHGSKGAFIDVELDLWYAVQARLRRCPADSAAAAKRAS
jgi:hypothetical protein